MLLSCNVISETRYVIALMWRHRLSPLHILSMAAIHADTSVIHCRRKAYIVACYNLYRYINLFLDQAKGATIYEVNFETNCRRRQNLPSTFETNCTYILFKIISHNNLLL